VERVSSNQKDLTGFVMMNLCKIFGNLSGLFFNFFVI